ncbi:MAG: putative toxin-antitoxin system toxin component, PIN family [Coriobacteriia bacterium]|nr:putative toxin-antitoxin system toxin component, PIN family [Coriobacteriia bacterium]
MKKYNVVIDTNVVVSSLLKRKSNPWQILQYVAEGKIVPLVNGEILLEYNKVLNRNKFDFNKKDIDICLLIIFKHCLCLDRMTTDELFIDKQDIVFYEIALAARERGNSYLITGNKKHFPEKPFVVSPREMVDIIKNNK